MKNLIKGTLAGGLIAFVWSIVSWTAIPWHFDVLNAVPNETEVAQTLKNISNEGVYVIPNPHNPNMEEFHKNMTAGPYAYMMVIPNGKTPNMPVMMGTGFVMHLLIALMLTWALTKTSGLGFMGKVSFVVIAVSTGTIYAHVAYLNWWFFPLDYTLIYLVDVIVGWSLAGAAMAKLVD